MISANLQKINSKDEPCKEGELVDYYRFRISCGATHAEIYFYPGGPYGEMAVELRRMADILDGKAE